MPFSAEGEILADNSADPVALTEVEAQSEEEMMLQEAGRDLRPDTIVPGPDITAAEAAAIESLEAIAADEVASDAAIEETFAPAVLEETASSESTDEEKQAASQDDAEN